ncbi:MAG: hypothetical protein JKX87_06955 [Cycloclasticus sp.]|nr:hypothetical protein [Cycloclasticus sp.]
MNNLILFSYDQINTRSRESAQGHFNREGLCVYIDISLLSSRVIRSLKKIIEWRGNPLAIRCNNDPEYIRKTLEDCKIKQQITFLYIQLGKPTQNAYIEQFIPKGHKFHCTLMGVFSFNRRAKYERLGSHLFNVY